MNLSNRNYDLLKKFCEEQGEDETQIDFYYGLFTEMDNDDICYHDCAYTDLENSINYYNENFQGVFDSIKDFLIGLLTDLYNVDAVLRCYIDFEHFENDTMMDYSSIYYKGKYYIFRVV